jgi:RNA polymerase sigma-70 factor, ECF subfamily
MARYDGSGPMIYPDAAMPSGSGCAGPDTVLATPATLDDRERLRSVVASEFDFVWRSLRRLGLADSVVDDAAQQVFVVLTNRIADVQRGRERSFLFGVVRRVAAETRRAPHLRREMPQEDLDIHRHPSPNAEDLLEAKRRREYLDRLLDQLTPELREALILYEGEGLTMHEMADLLELPMGTVASRLRRARERFEALVKHPLGLDSREGGHP